MSESPYRTDPFSAYVDSILPEDRVKEVIQLKKRCEELRLESKLKAAGINPNNLSHLEGLITRLEAGNSKTALAVIETALAPVPAHISDMKEYVRYQLTEFKEKLVSILDSFRRLNYDIEFNHSHIKNNSYVSPKNGRQSWKTFFALNSSRLLVENEPEYMTLICENWPGVFGLVIISRNDRFNEYQIKVQSRMVEGIDFEWGSQFESQIKSIASNLIIEPEKYQKYFQECMDVPELIRKTIGDKLKIEF